VWYGVEGGRGRGIEKVVVVVVRKNVEERGKNRIESADAFIDKRGSRPQAQR
jgi:hypothetical protein